MTATRAAPRRLLDVYRALLATELQAASAYRAQLLIGAIGAVVPVAFLALWRSAAGTSGVEGISAGQFTTYFCVLLVTAAASFSQELSFGVEPLVYTGELSALLLRPSHPLHVLIARGISQRCYRLTPLLILAPVLVLALGGSVVHDRAQWVLAAVVGALGFACVTYLGAMMGCVALWLTQSGGVRGLLNGAEWILGGLVAPVSLLPWVLPTVVRHQPLWFGVGAPAAAIAGITTLTVWTVVEAAVWLVALRWLFGVVWRRGMLRYEAVGT